MKMRRFLFCSLAAAWWFGTLAAARAQGFVFTKIVDNNDPIPGGAGKLFEPTNEPALEGDTVVFRSGGALNPDSIWSRRLGGEAVKLVDRNTAVPGGVGNFSEFIVFFDRPGLPQVRGGTVVFGARDSNPAGGFNAGLYSVPAAGGAISRVVDYHIPIPGGTGNFNNGLGRFSLDGGRVAFEGSGAGNGGVFAANVDGNGLLAIADTKHPAHPEFLFKVDLFSSPSISAGKILFQGSTVFDASTGYNSLFTSSANATGTYTEIATSNQPLPGDANGNFHTRFDSLRLGGGIAAFVADDTNTNPNFFGLYTVSATGGAFQKIITSTESLPGLTNINNNSFKQYATQGGLIAFNALDDNDHVGLYLANANGTELRKFLVSGDTGPFADTGATLGGLAGNPVDIGVNAVSNGRVVFRAYGGIYLATPTAQSADVQMTLTDDNASAPVTANSTRTFRVTVTNAGPATATEVKAILTLPPSLRFQPGVTDDPGVFTVDTGTLIPGGSQVFTVTALAVSTTAGTVSGRVTSPTPDPDLNNNRAFVTVATPAPSPNDGQYIFAKIADNRTPVPDRSGETFILPNGYANPPAVDGGKVVFLAFDADNKSILWSANADGSGGLTRLVDASTPMPGGAGDTFASVQYVRLRGDRVAFVGYGTGQHDGIFSVPVGGGEVLGLATQDSPRPDGSKNFVYQDFIQSFLFGYLNDGQVGFTAQGGTYAYPVAGGTPHTLVFPGTVFRGASNRTINQFGAPAFSGTRAVFPGNNSELVGTFFDERRFVALADTDTPSPSTPDGNFAFSFNETFSNPQVEGDTVAFRGLSGANPPFPGIYSLTGNGPAVLLADTLTPIPGGTGNFAAFTSQGSPELVALNSGEVVFIGADSAGKAGLYSVPATGGAITKVIARGDSLGGTLTMTGDPNNFQTNGLGGHRVAFRADFFDTSTNQGGTGIFVAAPNGLVPPEQPTVTLSVDAPQAIPGGAPGVVTLTRTGDTSETLKVTLSIKGTARNGVDYARLPTTKKIKAGKSSAKIRVVPLTADGGGTARKALKITVRPGEGYELGDSVKGKVKIIYEP